MPPTPKPKGARIRRNIDQGRWKTLPPAKDFERPPPLPPKPTKDEDSEISSDERLESLTRAELDDVARQQGIPAARGMPNKAAVITAIRERRLGWLSSTLEWWQLAWASPMSVMWIEADVPSLAELAKYRDIEARGLGLATSEMTRKTHLEDRYGFSPKARRQLQWEISKGSETETKQHEARSRSRVRAVDSRDARALARR